MYEIDVALSDYAISFFTTLFAVSLLRSPAGNAGARIWLVVLFLSLAAGALFGGTSHGFFPDNESFGHDILWLATMIAMGVTALGTWNAGAALVFQSRLVRLVAILSSIAFAIYCGYILLVSQAFIVAIVNYLPASLFLLVAFGVVAYKTSSRLAFAGVCGVLLTFVAAVIQQAKITVHPDYLTHNTLYHLVQLAGLWLIFLGGRWAAQVSKR
jgi:hypothetical protein